VGVLWAHGDQVPRCDQSEGLPRRQFPRRCGVDKLSSVVDGNGKDLTDVVDIHTHIKNESHKLFQVVKYNTCSSTMTIAIVCVCNVVHCVQVGFWGPPGSPSTPHRSPMGVPPLVINTQPTQSAYQEAYPEGVHTRYYLQTSTDREFASSASATGTPTAATEGIHTPLMSAYSVTTGDDASVLISSSLGLVCLGIGIGLMVRYIYDALPVISKQRLSLFAVGSKSSERHEYVPVGDGVAATTTYDRVDNNNSGGMML
jgi:hypothetical protein